MLVSGDAERCEGEQAQLKRIQWRFYQPRTARGEFFVRTTKLYLYSKRAYYVYATAVSSVVHEDTAPASYHREFSCLHHPLTHFITEDITSGFITSMVSMHNPQNRKHAAADVQTSLFGLAVVWTLHTFPFLPYAFKRKRLYSVDSQTTAAESFWLNRSPP